jgi:hypothetical protein
MMTNAVPQPRRAGPLQWLLAVGWPALVYLSLHQSTWTRGGDAEIYLSIARSISQGEGIRFNGNPAALVQPLWPVVLSLAMDVTDRIAWLKLLPIGLLLIYAACSFAVLRRFMHPWLASGAVALTMCLSTILVQSQTFFTDPLFAAIASGAVLLTLQVREGRPWQWRVALIIVLMIAGTLTRAVGLFFWLTPALMLLSFGGWRSLKHVVLVAAMGAMSISTFSAHRAWSRVEPEQIDQRYDTFLSGHYSVLGSNAIGFERELADRLLRPGRWLAILMWETIGRDSDRGPAAGFFWLVWSSLLLWLTLREALRGEYFWAGCWLHLHLLSLAWPHPIARYLMPVAPFIVAGMALALVEFVRSLQDGLLRAGTITVAAATLASVVYVNASIAYVELQVARHPDPLSVHEGGSYRSLASIATWSKLHLAPQDSIAISHTRGNIYTRGNMVVLHWLSDRPVRIVPAEISSEPESIALLRWLRQQRIGYYVWQPRYRASLYTTDALDAVDLSAHHERVGFRLYRVTSQGLERLDFRDRSAAVKSVPGLSER